MSGPSIPAAHGRPPIPGPRGAACGGPDAGLAQRSAWRPAIPGSRGATRGSPSRLGFSLLEVLVALAIAGLGLAVALRGFATSLQGADRAAQQIALTRKAQSLLAELRAEARAPFDLSGTDPDGLAWHAVLAPVAAHPLPPPAPVAGGQRAGSGREGGQGGAGEGGRDGAPRPPPPRLRAVLLHLEVTVTPAGLPAPRASLTSSLVLIEPIRDAG